jgi:hypothetical protein
MRGMISDYCLYGDDDGRLRCVLPWIADMHKTSPISKVVGVHANG